MKQMYDSIYEIYMRAGIAKKLDTPVFQDMNGKVVMEEEQFGEAVDIQIL